MRRLRIQADALAFEAGVLLDRIGVGDGWRCLDLGCGAGGITDLLSRRVGRLGQVVGLDPDPVNLAAAQAWAGGQRLRRVAFVQGDAFAPPLRDEAFDLVHLRYVMTTIGRHREVVEAALRLVRPGGWLAVEEADAAGLACYPDHPAWERLRAILFTAFARAGADVFAGRQVYRLLLEAGLEEVGFRPCQAGARRGDPLADFLPATVLSTKPVILREGLASEPEIDGLVAECRRHLSDPATVHTSVTVIQAWGRKRSGSRPVTRAARPRGHRPAAPEPGRSGTRAARPRRPPRSGPRARPDRRARRSGSPRKPGRA